MKAKTIALSITALVAAIAASIFYFTKQPSPPTTVGEICQAYAVAIEAVAEARDNLNQPTWENIVKSHPVLLENEKNKNAVTYAKAISHRLTGTKNSPRALKSMVFEQCHTTFLCLHLGVCNSK